MMTVMKTVAVAILLAAGHTPAWAQVLARSDTAVVYGHHHVNATSLDTHKRFWVEALGGAPVTLDVLPTDMCASPASSCS